MRKESKLLEKLDKFYDFISEAPWVSLGSKTVDLELEKQPHNRTEIIAHIRSKLDSLNLNFRDRILFLNNLFQTFPVMMNKLGVKKNDLW